MGYKVRSSEVTNIRESFNEETKRQEERKSNNSSAKFATWIPKQDQGSLRVRFLANPDEGWATFDQWYVPGKGSVIATEENFDEYYDMTGKYPAQRFYAPALNIETNETIVLDVPKKLLKDTLIPIADTVGSPKGDMTTFDVTLFKTGAGTDTSYLAVPSGLSPLDLSRYEVPSARAALEAKIAYQEGRDTREDHSDQIKDEQVPFTPTPKKDLVSETPAPQKRRVVRKKA